MSILLGQGDGRFILRGEFELTGPNIDYFGSPNDLALGDLNGDGKPDLAATGLRGFGVLLGNGDGTFAVRVEKRDLGGGIELADMNRDGKLDLLIRDSGLDLQLGNGDGTFQPAVHISEFASGDPVTAELATARRASAQFATRGLVSGETRRAVRWHEVAANPENSE